MSGNEKVTAVIINFKTADLTHHAVASFRKYYPIAHLLLIDNGSNDESTTLLRAFAEQHPATNEVLINTQNMHHGPAMDQAMRRARSPYVFFMDSDCEILRGEFLEKMIAQIERSDNTYAVGKQVFMNRRGFDVPEKDGETPYIRPMFMLVDRELYFSLPPFQHHGTPCLVNMREARRRGLGLIDFPVDDYMIHRGRGTAGRYGYGLGWRGKLNHFLNKFGL